MKNKADFKIIKILKIIILSIIVICISVFFINQKEDLDLDEMYTYGLANSSFQLNVEDYKNYTGNELLLDYAGVKDGHEFDIKNVIFNQSMDTHPPIYYMMVNFISSIHKNHFSIWHGLIINVIFLIILFFEMRQLFMFIIDDELSSTIFSITALFSYGFINCFVFTRMYVLLSAISMAFIILVQYKIVSLKNNNLKLTDNMFLILFFVNCIIGILTQYHFVLIAGFFSVYFLINLFLNKNYRLLIKTIIAGLSSIVLSVLLYPSMLKHIFANSGSLHSITNEQKKDILTTLYEMALTIKRAFFSDFLIIYILLLIILIIISVLIYLIKNKKNKLSNTEKTPTLNSNNNYLTNYYFYFILLICFIYYYLIISFTTKLTFARYFYNIYPIIAIVIISPIYVLLKNLNNKLKYISIIIFILLCFGSRYKEQPFSLNIGNNQYFDFLNQNKDVKTILLYRDTDLDGNANTAKTSVWKMPKVLYNFRNMEDLTFVNIKDIDNFINNSHNNISGFDDIFVVIFTKEDDESLLDIVKQKNNVKRINKIYFNTYYHMYRLN